MKCFILIFSIVLLSHPVWAGDTQATAGTEPVKQQIYSNFPIILNMKQMEADQFGTDIENIYTITVDYQSDQFRNQNSYTIMLYLDGIAVEGFKNQSLPLAITRNYKGQRDGVHQIKINVEDGQGNVLATNSIQVMVKHQGNKLK